MPVASGVRLFRATPRPGGSTGRQFATKTPPGCQAPGEPDPPTPPTLRDRTVPQHPPHHQSGTYGRARAVGRDRPYCRLWAASLGRRWVRSHGVVAPYRWASLMVLSTGGSVLTKLSARQSRCLALNTRLDSSWQASVVPGGTRSPPTAIGVRASSPIRRSGPVGLRRTS